MTTWLLNLQSVIIAYFTTILAKPEEKLFMTFFWSIGYIKLV